MDQKFDTIIIGAGLSGLLCGTLLSRKGHRVCILEKNPEIGGAVQPFIRHKMTFDTGMHFFGAVNEGQIQKEIFKLFGIDKKINLVEKKGTPFKVIKNGKLYEIPCGFNKFKKKMEEYFPGEKQAVGIYVEKIKHIFNGLTIENIYKKDRRNDELETGAYEFIKSISNNSAFNDLLAFNNMLYGGDKGTSSLYLHAVIIGSYISSTYEFKNGTKDFLDLLKNEIISNSGEIHTSKKVVKIETKTDHISVCICSDGTEFSADNYISSLHPELSLRLTKSDYLKRFYRERILSLNNYAGAFLVYIIMKKKSFKFMDNILFYNNSEFVWSSESKGHSDFMMYTPYSGKSGNYAEIVKIMRYMDFSEVEKWKAEKSRYINHKYNQFKKSTAEKIFNSVSEIYPEFETQIDKYNTSTPLTYLDYTGTPKGSMYGVIHDFNKFSQSNIPVRTKIKNLFLTGQSINFHGMLGVSITALLTCSAVIGKEIID